MCSDVVISVKNLSKTYRIFGHPGDRIKQAFTLGRVKFHHEFTALKEVSFEIKRGETVGIIGRNGSGKSTLLQLICGILKPTSGTLQVDGRISALLELGAGFNPEFTGRENVYFQGAVMGISKDQMDSRFDEIIAFADIGEFIEQPVRTYSSGMFVRLAFATAIHTAPGILVVDEALSVGDMVFTQRCMAWIRGFKNRGGTILLVSHDLYVLNGLCDRALWLSSGHLEKEGRTREVSEAYMNASFGQSRAAKEITDVSDKSSAVSVDQRLPFLNASNLRNDLKIFPFDPNASSFGTGQANIVNVSLVNEVGEPYSWVVGGESVTIEIKVESKIALSSPIIGFFVKDKMGQALFGDNTYLTYIDTPLSVPAGTVMQGSFRFQMPRLPPGEYSICVAIADGTQHAHTTHQWIHSALIFEARSSSVNNVLVGLPMQKISMTITSAVVEKRGKSV